ncbi:MAG: DoxX family protein [Amphiplicatus sp.]
MSKLLKHAPALLLAVFLAMMGVQKFGAENVIFATIAERSGVSLFEPQIRMLVGVAEIIAAILLLLPRTRLFGALGAVAIIGGAIGFHLSPWLGISVAMAPGGEPTSMLFMMAAGSFVLAVIVLILMRATRADRVIDKLDASTPGRS